MIKISKEYVNFYLKLFIKILILSSFVCAEYNMPKIFLNCGYSHPLAIVNNGAMNSSVQVFA